MVFGDNPTNMVAQHMPQMPNEIPDKELSFGLWFENNKIKIIRMILIALIFIVVITWGWFILVYADYYVFSRAQEQALQKQLATMQPTGISIIDSQKPQDLIFGDAMTFSATADTDILLTVQNPNPNWVATFTYTFQFVNDQTTPIETVVLPGDTTYIVSTLHGAHGTPTYQISNVHWKYINAQEITDFAQYRSERMNFTVTNASMRTSNESKSLPRAGFTVVNQTPWSYWQVRFVMLFYGGSTIRGVSQITLDEFRANETRTPEISLPQSLGGISDIQIIPQVNILDASAYMPLPKAAPR